MSLKTEIEKKIDKKNQEIAGLETQIREARAHIQGLQEALRLAAKDPDIDVVGSVSPTRAQEFRATSDMAKAADYVRGEGKPCHISDIVKGIGKEPTKPNIKSVAGAMNNYARQKRVFVRTAENTFSLIAFEEPTPDVDLPDDFGVDTQDVERAS
jgi:hypothetical protein